MVRRLSRRAFSAGLTLGIPAALLGKAAASQAFLDPEGVAFDLESVFLRVTPYDVRDLLISSSLGDGYNVSRWANIGQSPYFSSVGGVLVEQSALGTPVGAYGIYLAAAGARAGQYLGRRALESLTTSVQAQVVGGYPAEVLSYDDGANHTLTQIAVGNVMILGYDVSEAGESVSNAEMLLAHLHEVFSAQA